MASRPSRKLKTFPNPVPERDYEIEFECPEFTCLSPLTGQPIFFVNRTAAMMSAVSSNTPPTTLPAMIAVRLRLLHHSQQRAGAQLLC